MGRINIFPASNPNIEANCLFRPSIHAFDMKWTASLADKNYVGLLFIPVTEYLNVIIKLAV
jgi:hypothetical protein